MEENTQSKQEKRPSRKANLLEEINKLSEADFANGYVIIRSCYEGRTHCHTQADTKTLAHMLAVLSGIVHKLVFPPDAKFEVGEKI